MSGLPALGAGNRNGNESASLRFRCGVGGEWKVASHFSQRQIQIWNTKSRRFPNLTPATVGIVCREHSGEPRSELQCQGPCNEWLPRDMFSKNTRAKGKIWCIKCTEWQKTNEPGYLPYIAPRGDASYDELSRLGLGVRSRHLRDKPIFDYDEEDDTDQEWEEAESYLPTESSIPATSQHVLAAAQESESGLATRPSTGQDRFAAAIHSGTTESPATSSGQSSSTRSGTGQGRPTVAIHSGNTEAAAVSGSQSSTTDMPINRHPSTGQSGPLARSHSAGRAPHHLLPSFNDLSLSSSQTESLPSLGETATTAGNASNDNAPPVLFNAYDGRGHVLRVEKAPTVLSDAPLHTRNRGERSSIQSGWARPATRKTDMMPPEYLKWHGLASNNNLDDPDGSDDEC